MQEQIPIIKREDGAYDIAPDHAKSRAVLRARSVISLAFISGLLRYYSVDNRVYFGEAYVIGNMMYRVTNDPCKDMLWAGSLNICGEQDGWKMQHGWCCLDIEVSVEHTMFKAYTFFAYSARYLSSKPELIDNIKAARNFSYKTET